MGDTNESIASIDATYTDNLLKNMLAFVDKQIRVLRIRATLTPNALRNLVGNAELYHAINRSSRIEIETYKVVRAMLVEIDPMGLETIDDVCIIW